MAQSSKWKRLLHYRQGWLGSEKSEADGTGFFLSDHGKTDPEAELLADLAAFQNPQPPLIGPAHQRPQCAFPARYQWLRKELQLQTSADVCTELSDWKKRFHAKSVTVVYAAAYFGSPSSMFGHTFLRIDSAPREGQYVKSDLLDYGISYEAETGNNPGLSYPIKGLLGLYPGKYSQMPYYLKTNSYVNMDSRDMWEYQIRLSPEQLDQLLNHIWEMDMTYFSYYFFNRNCSYQLLTVFEVANPDWSMKQQFGAMAIPVDTIRALLQQKDALLSVHYRPSILHIIQNRLARMSPADQDRFYQTKDNVELVTDQDSAAVLDSLMDWQKFQAMKNSISAEDAEKHIDMNLLRLRARLPKSADEDFEAKPENWPARPDLGHASSKISLNTGSESNTGYLGFELRPAFHDLLDPDSGYLPDSELNVGRLRASALTDGSGTTRLDEFVLAEVINYQPISKLKTNISWQMSGGWTRPVDTGCTACFAEFVQGGAGLTFGSPEASIGILATGHAEFSNSFNSSVGQNNRAGPGAELIGILRVSDHIKALASIEHIRYFPGPDQHYLNKAEGAFAYNFSSFEVRVTADSYASPWQNIQALGASFGHYF